MQLEINSEQRLTQDTSHDRLSVLRDAGRTLIALADGNDATPGSQLAAARTVRELARSFRNRTLPGTPGDWEMVLEAIDQVIFADPDAGETSALVILVHDDIVTGASVGDSLAYIIPPAGRAQILTAGDQPRPRMGSGYATPLGFGPTRLDGRLITRRAPRKYIPWLSPDIAVA